MMATFVGILLLIIALSPLQARRRKMFQRLVLPPMIYSTVSTADSTSENSSDHAPYRRL
jgi:hypothetical protein